MRGEPAIFIVSAENLLLITFFLCNLLLTQGMAGLEMRNYNLVINN